VRTEGIGQRGEKLVNFLESLKMEQILGYLEILRIKRFCCSKIGFFWYCLRDLQGFWDTLKVDLLVFLELWLRKYPLSCGSG